MSNLKIFYSSFTLPHFELIESGIPKGIYHLRGYRYVTKEETYEPVGYKFSVWVVLFAIQ